MKNHSFHKSTYIKPESPPEIKESKEFGGSEYYGDKNEFSSERRNEFADDEGVLRVPEKNNNDKKKKLKKMAYLIASAFSVFMLATAAQPEATADLSSDVTTTAAPTKVAEGDEDKPAKPTESDTPTPTAEPTNTVEDTLDDWEITTPYYESWSLEEDALMCAVTVYNDSFGDDGKNLVVADLNDYGTPSTIYIDLPAPIPQDNFVFLGYVVYGGYETMPDGTKLAKRAFPVKDNNIDLYELCRVSTRPEEVEVHAAWRCDLKEGAEPSDYVLVFHSNTGKFTDEGHEGLTTVEYEALSPMLSGSVIYPLAYPAPEKDGYAFAGWYYKDSDDPCYMIQAADFIAWEEGEDGETHPDWSKKHEIHLYAKWRKA